MGALFIFVRFARNAHRTSIKNTQIFPKWKSGVNVSVRLHLYKCQRSPTFMQCQSIVTFPRYMLLSVSSLLHLARYVKNLTHYVNRNDSADISTFMRLEGVNNGKSERSCLRYYLHMFYDTILPGYIYP